MTRTAEPAPVFLVFGTRPETVKLAPVARALVERRVPCRVVVTGQHRELLQQMLDVFGLTADVSLDLMRHDQRLTDFGGRALQSLGKVLRRERPSMVVVQGDTSTVFFGALAAFYEGIPVAHVEAGLRSHDLSQPFPEEGNRVLTSRLTTLHFAPTELSRQNLLVEGIPADRIHVTGNTVVDSLRYMGTVLRRRGPSKLLAPVLRRRRKRVAITVHRRENFGAPLERIFRAFARVAAERPDVDFVYPVHPNPNVRSAAARLLGGRDNLHLLPPLDYLDFVTLLGRSALCLTDSGGVQEEAPSFGIPILVLRGTTERPEGVTAGCAELVGSDEDLIVERALTLLARDGRRAKVNPYGDGRASLRIARIIEGYLRRR